MRTTALGAFSGPGPHAPPQRGPLGGEHCRCWGKPQARSGWHEPERLPLMRGQTSVLIGLLGARGGQWQSRPPPQGDTGRLRRTISPTSSKMSPCASPTVPAPQLKGPWWDSLSSSSRWIQLLSCYLGLGMERGPRMDTHVRIST